LSGPGNATHPNVVVFFTDQQRWDTTGLHGNPMDLTPNLDRVARVNTHVAYSFTCQPVCGPARSCLQTGLYATTTGCYRNAIPLPDDARTLAHSFREAGYNTGYIGKWHLYERDTKGPVPADKRFGYDYWLASNILEFTSDAYDTVMYDNDGDEVRLPGYRVDAVTDAAIRYIDTQARSTDPFYLFVSYIEPHHQNHIDDYPPPDGYRERYTGGWIPPDLAALGGSTHQHLGGYYGMVKRLDEAYGRVHDALKSLGLDQDTIVLFTSDHGSHFKTRNSEYKRSCHDSSIRVPTVFSGPGFVGGGQIQQLVSLIDLPPTLLDAAGLEVPEPMQGRSILPLLKGRSGRGDGAAQDWPEEVFVQISEAQTARAVRTHRWKYSVDAGEGVKEAWAPRFEEQYLYDLQADPYELTNLIHAESHRPVADVMRQRLRRRMADAGEQVPEIVAAPVKAVGQRRVGAVEAQQ
jgi:arylsulfatase A-like enzyme